MKELSAENSVINQCYLTLEKHYALTKKEVEIVKKLNFHGFNNRDLATSLNMAEKTIKNHMGRILEKTSTHSARQLQALFFRLILTSIP